MVNQCPISQRDSTRMTTIPVVMPQEMIEQIESVASKQSFDEKKVVSRSKIIRDFCQEGLDKFKLSKKSG